MFLKSADVEPLSERVPNITVSEAIRLWGTRLKNVQFTNKPIQGVECLLMRLAALAPEDELEQFNFTGRDFLGILFFALNDQEFVGLVFVDRVSTGDPSLKI
jgi:hypothetical protein